MYPSLEILFKTPMRKRIVLYSIGGGLFLCLAPLLSFAASLSFSASPSSYEAGKVVSLDVVVASADKAMNAVSGVLVFPKDKIEILSISKIGSIVNFWTTEPIFSNSQGTLRFEGIVLDPGFRGASGKIFTITFQTKIPGTASFVFLSASVLANDGKGTIILTEAKNKEIFISSGGTASPVAPISPNVPAAPSISSATHPNQNKWYRNPNPELSWVVPSDATAVRASYDKNPTGEPTTLYIPPIFKKQFNNLADGVWYFHLQARNSFGWGPSAHFRFQIDTTPPYRFSITFPHGKSVTDPRPVTLFNTTDQLSGIDHYEVKVGQDTLVVSQNEVVNSNPYILPTQAPGEHALEVLAYDGAGNVATAMEQFSIGVIDPPSFIRFRESPKEGEIWQVEGTTYPNSVVAVYLKQKGREVSEKTTSDETGHFALVWPGLLKRGTYEYWGVVKDNHGAVSNQSAHLVLTIQPNGLFAWGPFSINLPQFLVLVFVVITFLFMIILYQRQKGRSPYVLANKVLTEGDQFVENLVERLKVLEDKKILADLDAYLEEKEQSLKRNDTEEHS